ncbi:FAD-dependent oxidoreductase [Marinomonas mediterranea]|uniref:NAD(P)/FAD-dependent oxidoreductase n=1 Tax=Marinomonas mediterranea TaxID=119864 RepID=UPI002349B7F4|nr:FAD-dependent oxidoreductase [Marinomonas mediterranea]WCN15237.1 FAD-dependent oxidoreductase [Marinomonas mediterranea]
MKQRCVIVGGGHAGAQVSTSLRKLGWEGKITVFTNEYSFPYHRPPLSKSFLLGNTTEHELLIRPEIAYAKDDIDVLINQEVRDIHPERHSLVMQDGSNIHYDKLVLCMGSKMRRLDVLGSDLRGIFYIKTIRDIRMLSEYLEGGQKNIVMVGGGYVSLETAAVLRKMGHLVTILVRSNRILNGSTSAPVSDFLLEQHTRNGVNIMTQKSVSHFVEDSDSAEHKMRQVVCTDGSRYGADLVVIGVGSDADSELARKAGLDVTDGIVVDQYGRTSQEDIFAAGDCTSQLQSNGIAMQIASVPNALEQAKSVASTICGKPKSSNAVQWFWSDQYENKLQMAGLNHGHDQTVLREKSHDQFSLWYLRDGRVIASECINSPADFMLSKRMIAAKTCVPSHVLADVSCSLNEYAKPVKRMSEA